MSEVLYASELGARIYRQSRGQLHPLKDDE